MALQCLISSSAGTKRDSATSRDPQSFKLKPFTLNVQAFCMDKALYSKKKKGKKEEKAW